MRRRSHENFEKELHAEKREIEYLEEEKKEEEREKKK